jgi:hypothetical protein
MSNNIRVRRHTDGRAAISTSIVQPGWWWLVGGYGAAEVDVSGDGWSELLIAELPEPDRWAKLDEPYWNTSAGPFIGYEPSNWKSLDEIRSDALKMLAAVVASERRQQEVRNNAR